MSDTDGAPSLQMTEAAIERLKGLVEQAGDPPVSGIRLSISRRGPDGFEHQLTMVDAGREAEEDEVVSFDGLVIYIEDRNAEYLDGVSVHWEFKGEGVNGFEFNNPNPLWLDSVAMAVQQLFDESLNPSIAAHGGFVDLLGVEGVTVYVALGGGCQGCGMANVTLKQGIEVAIKEVAPHITQIVDATDHDSGTNPYYQPEKK